MNAALVLMAAACVAGNHGSTPVASHNCCGTTGHGYSYTSDCCDCYDDCCRESFLDRMRNRFGGMFNRGGCGCDTSCDCGYGGAVHHHSYSSDCCDTGYADPCCDSGFQFGSRLRGLFQGGLFRRNNDCCDPCGGYYGAYGATDCCDTTHGHVGPGAEKIGPPKNGEVMPKAKDGNNGGANTPPGGGQEPPINNTPPANNIAEPQSISSPNDLEIVPPAVVPPIPGNFNKSPF